MTYPACREIAAAELLNVASGESVLDQAALAIPVAIKLLNDSGLTGVPVT